VCLISLYSHYLHIGTIYFHQSIYNEIVIATLEFNLLRLYDRSALVKGSHIHDHKLVGNSDDTKNGTEMHYKLHIMLYCDVILLVIDEY